MSIQARSAELLLIAESADKRKVRSPLVPRTDLGGMLTVYLGTVSHLQTSQFDLQTLLSSTQNTEREARRDLSSASEELAALRSAHAREVDDLERTTARKDREKRALEDEVKDSRDELSREREVVRELKVSRVHPLIR